MSADALWLRTETFAELAAISPQAARRAVRQALTGKSWRGCKLAVRHCLGRGGRGGFAYEIEASSLPESLQATLPQPSRPSAASTSKPREQGGTIDHRYALIAPALDQLKGSRARAGAIASVAATAGLAERTIYRWVDQYEAHGVRGLARAKSSALALPRVVVSRRYDRAFRAAGYAPDTHVEIGAELQRTLKGLWASRAESAGSAEVRRLAEFLLLEIGQKRGVDLPKESIRLSRRGVEKYAHFRVVNQRRNDRKAFDDAKPRIRRDWTGLDPMERIVADVKHLDVIVTRADGSPAWPKIVAFMDAGTGRVFVHPVLLEAGEGVRQEHVIGGFLAMVSEKAWGFPQGLYLDNGSEFGALTKIDGALRLINEPGARTLIFARPYNASAKPIESLFARLDRYVFSMMPGYAGPNRMAKKTQSVGKPPAPYPGDWRKFCATLQGLIAAHNLRPVGGQWGDRSPQDWLEAKVAIGWKSASIDLPSLDAAFSDHDSRRVDRGVIKLRGQRFTHPDLAALPSRTVVDLALPWRRGAEPMARVRGEWVYLQRETLYPARWIEGARESDRRQRSQSKYVSALAREAPVIDPVATKIRWSQQPRPCAPARPPSLDLGQDLRERADLAAPPRTADAPPKPTAAEARRAREMALTERLERMQRDDG